MQEDIDIKAVDYKQDVHIETLNIRILNIIKNIQREKCIYFKRILLAERSKERDTKKSEKS